MSDGSHFPQRDSHRALCAASLAKLETNSADKQIKHTNNAPTLAMSLRTLAAIPLAAALTLLAACATKPVVTHVAEPPYTGPRITLHTAPGVTAFAIQPADPLPTAISYLNARRAELGLNAITADPLVAQAAAAHAHYLEVNRASSHDESENLPGFSGADVATRVRQYTETTGASEVFAVYGGQRVPALPIEEIFDSPYHRGAMLYDWARAGEAVASGDSQITVVDFADPKPAISDTELVVYPYDGQRNAPLSWQNIEQPDPMGPNSRYRGALLGYPLTVSGGTNAHILLEKFELRDGRGKLVSCQIAPLTSADTGRNTAVCTPFSPLHPGTTYTAHATGRLTQQFGVANAPFDVRWSFSTIAAPVQIDNVVAQAANR
ncbi:CAP domain-containing protein [Paraburkholderia tropica]|uniref:CAP domain-containing protein n=1 Tax=Paraburkholderia tropica TaxID=92647 RepID=UPI001E5A591D|nr:CAP domain-containing protein [Paraburkholderia tropica]